jgi:voltage-gated potassium channel
MILMSIGTLVPATQDLAVTGQNLLLLVEMTVIGAFALVMSANVTAFMLYTGEVFRGFFSRLRRLAAPALAFLSLYTLIVVVFGCLYRILDMLSQAPSFTIAGELRAIQFTEALYFSVITMSTVGYGDITPLDDPIRVLVSVEIVLGVLLLLFGFAEIMKYARDPK